MTTASVELSRSEDGKHVLKFQTPNGCWANLYLEEIHAPSITAIIQWADYNLNRPATPIEELVDDFQRAVYEETVNRSVYSHEKSTVAEDKGRLLAAITTPTPPANLETLVKAVFQDAIRDLDLESGAPPGLRADTAHVLASHQQKILNALAAYNWAKDNRIAEIRRERDEAQSDAVHWEQRCKDDQGVWLATRDANIELGKQLAHLKANHDEMVARNKVFRDRPEIQGDIYNKLNKIGETLACGHPKQCIGRMNEHDRTEELHCLWCGDITDMAMLVKHCSTIYSSVTDGRISKPNTLPEEVIAVAADLETERTEAAVKDAVADNGDSYRDHLYEEQRHIVPYTGEIEPGASVTIHWKVIPGEVDGPTVDHGYVFVFPHEDAEVGACVHIPHPDARGDRDVSPEWPTVNDLLANILIERIEFLPPAEGCPPPALGCPPLALTSFDEHQPRYQWCLGIVQRLDELGVLRLQRGRLLSEVIIADKHLNQGKAA